jgi:coenzyme F420-reducing hydrogenase delta subunit
MKMKTADDIKVQSERYKDWQPRIRLFCCQCAGGGSALDLEAPEGIRVEFVPCTGKVDIPRLAKAFEGGDDGICIIGCPPDGCKMAEGSLRATSRVTFVHKLLDEIGIEGARIEIVLPGSAAEALDEAVRAFHNKVLQLGPSTLGLVNAQK